MTRSLCHIVAAADAGARLDALMAERGLYPSRSAAARASEEGAVFVTGANVAKKHAVAAGDTVVYEAAEEAAPRALEGEPIDLDIRFEDEHLLVLSKQVGLVCHPSVDHYDGTLVNALVHHCGAANLCNVQGEDDRLGIVHRLDRDTSGLMLAAKTDEAGYALMEDIRARAEKERTRMAVRDVPSARDAVTTFRVLERFEHGPRDDGYSLIDCKLFTGRTHQIRVHMEYAKHPLAGEPVYRSRAPKDPAADLGLERQFQHSFQLAFTHPATGEELSFADNLPADLQAALDSLADRSRGRTEAGEEVFELLRDAPRPRL